MIAENYANQESVAAEPEDGNMTPALHRAWGRQREAGEGFSDELADALRRKAAAGSWMAGSMLHLSEIEWDGLIGDQPFVYEPAVFHHGKYAAHADIFMRGPDRDES